MYEVSNEYEQLILADSTKHKLNVYIDNQKIDDKYVLGCSITCKLFENDEFVLGSTPARTCELKIHKNALPSTYNRIYIESGINNSNLTELIPMGYFNVDEISTEDDYIVKLILIDDMNKFEFNYDGSEILKDTASVTVLQVLQDICTKAGVELGSTDFLNNDTEIAVYDSTVSARIYVSYIAEQAGGYAVIGRDGKLYIKSIEEPVSEIELRKFSTYSFEEEMIISRVAYEDGVQDFKAGNTDNSTVWISSENMYIVSQSQIDGIYNQLSDFSCYGFKGDTIIDPAIDFGDVLLVDNKKILYQGSIEYKGKWKANIACSLQTKAKSDTMTTKISENTKIRRVESSIDQINGKITQVISTTETIEDKINTKRTQSGTNITLETEPADNQKPIEFKVDGRSEQATRSGKNLFNIECHSNNLGNEITIIDSGNYQIDWTIAASIVWRGRIKVDNIPVKANTDYIIQMSFDNTLPCITIIGDDTSESIKSGQYMSFWTNGLQFNTGENTSISIELYATGNNTTDLDTTKIGYINNIQLEEGTVVTEYEPYGASPSPEFPSPIESIGDDVNLLNADDFEVFDKQTDGSYLSNRDINVTNSKIDVNISTGTYVLSVDVKCPVGKNYRPRLYFEDGTYSSVPIQSTGDYVHNAYQFTTEQKITAIGFDFSTVSNEVQFKNFKLQKGTVATPYSPYGQGSLVVEQRGKNLLNQHDILNHNDWANIDITNLIKKNNPFYANVKLKNLVATPSAEMTLRIDYKLNGATKYIFGNTLQEDGLLHIDNKIIEDFDEGTTVSLLIKWGDKPDTIIYDLVDFYFSYVDNEYEEYKANEYNFYLSQPLRSLPNGVRDTLEEDGIHRRVGTIVFDGSDDENIYLTEEENLFRLSMNDYNSQSAYCSHFKVIEDLSITDNANANTVLQNNEIAFRDGTTKDRLYFKAYFTDVTEFKTWLSQNLVTVQYELAKEVIEPYDEYNKSVMDELKMYSWVKHISNSEDANMEISYYKATDDLDPRFNELQDGLAVTNTKVSKVEQDVDGIKQTVERVDYLTRVKEGFGTVTLENCKNGNILALSIVGDIELIYPSDDLFPSNDLYLKDTYLLIQSTVNGETATNKVHLPISELLYYDSTTYDEFIVEYNKAKIIHKVELDTNGNKVILQQPYEEYLGELVIELQDGENILTLESFSNCRIKAKYLEKTELTDALASKVEMHSEINQTAGKIESSVNQKLTNYSTTEEMNSKITQTATEINSEVSKKVGNDEVISKINQSAEAVGINANKIELSANDVLNLLAGNTINLSGKSIKISSDNFNVDENGNMSCNNATFNGGRIILDSGDNNNFIIGDSDNIDGDYTRMNGTAIEMHCQNTGVTTYVDPRNSEIFISDADYRSAMLPHLISVIDKANYNTNKTYIRPTGITTPNVTQTSREEQKKNFEKFTDALDILKKTDIYKYNLKSEKDTDKKHIGFVIGKNYNYSNEITAVDREGKEIGVDTYSMISVLWKAVQEQQEIIEELQNKGGQE